LNKPKLAKEKRVGKRRGSCKNLSNLRKGGNRFFGFWPGKPLP